MKGVGGSLGSALLRSPMGELWRAPPIEKGPPEADPFLLEAAVRIELTITDLQSVALPLGHAALLGCPLGQLSAHSPRSGGAFKNAEFRRPPSSGRTPSPRRPACDIRDQG
jgi:hypothetical protein